MEELIAKKDQALHMMQHEKDYLNAYQLFQELSSSITPTSDEEYNFKMVCLLDMCLCQNYIAEALPDEAFAERSEINSKAEKAVEDCLKLYKEARPNTWKEGKSEEEIRNDPLNPIISLTYVYLGNNYSRREQYLDAFRSYDVAISYYPDGEGKETSKRLIAQLGYRPFEPTPELAIYQQIRDDLFDHDKLSADLDELISIYQGEVTQDYLKAVAKVYAYSIIIVTHSLYLKEENKDILTKCVTIEKLAIRKGLALMWNVFPILVRSLFSQDIIRNQLLFDLIISIFDIELYDGLLHFLNKYKCFQTFWFLLNNQLSEKSRDTICYLLYRLADNLIQQNNSLEDEPFSPSELNQETLETLISFKSPYALLLLSKIMITTQIIPFLESKGVAEQYIDLLAAPDSTDEYIFNSIIGLVGVVSHWVSKDYVPLSEKSENSENKEKSENSENKENSEKPENKGNNHKKGMNDKKKGKGKKEEKEDPKLKEKELQLEKLRRLHEKKDKVLSLVERTPEAFARREAEAKKLISVLLDVLKSKRKIGAIIGYSYSLLTILLDWIGDSLKGKNIVILSSIMLSTHKDEKTIVQYIVTFLYEFSKYDMYVDEIKTTKPLIPTIKTIMKLYPTSQSIIERAVALEIITEQPDYMKFLQAGIIQFPDSIILKEFASHIPIEKLAAAL